MQNSIKIYFDGNPTMDHIILGLYRLGERNQRNSVIYSKIGQRNLLHLIRLAVVEIYVKFPLYLTIQFV